MKKNKHKNDVDGPVMIVTAVKTTPQSKCLRKVSDVQKDLLIQYFETHKGAIDIVSSNNTDPEVKKRIWAEVAEILNKIDGGAIKNDLKWSKTWADMKLYTKTRARQAKQPLTAVHARKPTDFDKRVLKVSGLEDLLQDWEGSVAARDFEDSTTFEKIAIEDSETEIVMTEGTDYEYIDEEEMLNEECNEDVKIPVYFESEEVTQYEYTEPVVLSTKIDKPRNKRKHSEMKHENSTVLEIQALDDIPEEEIPQEKRLKPNEIEENRSSEESENDERQQIDPMVGAINNLASALQSVASALSSIAEVAKTLNRR